MNKQTYDDNFILDKLAGLGDFFEVFHEAGQWKVAYYYKNQRYVIGGNSIEEAVCSAETNLREEIHKAEYTGIFVNKHPAHPQFRNICHRCKGKGKIINEDQDPRVLAYAFDVEQRNSPMYGTDHQLHREIEYMIHIKKDILRSLEIIDCPHCLGTGNLKLAEIKFNKKSEMEFRGAYSGRISSSGDYYPTRFPGKV